jgi:hypothetical protein
VKYKREIDGISDPEIKQAQRELASLMLILCEFDETARNAGENLLY